MPVAVQLPPVMTVDELLKWPGDGTGRRAELVDGVIRMQNPASDAHGTIRSNVHFRISGRLRKTPPQCRIVINRGVAPRLRTKRTYRAPELGVTCTPNRAYVHMLPDPMLLIEIRSPSNAEHAWRNIPPYATLPSVTEILIVESTRMAAELLRRQADGIWPQLGANCARRHNLALLDRARRHFGRGLSGYASGGRSFNAMRLAGHPPRRVDYRMTHCLPRTAP
jgi:Uma2 family endonuclease